MKDKEKRLQEYLEWQKIRKKNISFFYYEFSKIHREWLLNLTDAYKERGIFDVSPLMLSSYYKSYEDKQIAILVGGLLIIYNGRIMEQVYGLKKLLGEHPYRDLYENRAFVRLSNGENQTQSIAYRGSVYYYRVSNLLNRLWEIEHTTGRTLFETFMINIQEKQYTPYHALLSLFEDLPVSSPEYHINLTLLGLCGQKYLGTGLWEIKGIDKKLGCPNSVKLRKFLQLWMPNWNRNFSIREMSELLGFEDEIDLYYCFLAYKTLKKYRKKEVGRYLTTYKRLYDKGESNYRIYRAFKEKLPKIKFEKE